tara:strand:- start:6641 stop:7693 length:1053 start_codon:yes stop_codon:yes gene_type:complete
MRNKEIIYILILTIILIFSLISIKKLETFSNEKFKFYLYELNFVKEDLGIPYSIEIYNNLKNNKYRTKDPKEAKIFITCICNETNYPNYGNSRQRKELEKKLISKNKINEYVKNLEFFNLGKHVIFYHTDPKNLHENIINIPYHTNRKNGFIICPPSIANLNFNEKLLQDRKYFITFKGNFKSDPKREIVMEELLNQINKLDEKHFMTDTILLDRDPKKKIKDNEIDITSISDYSFNSFMENSVFGIIVEGDLPWSYRLTEVINSGTIPIIIEPESNVLPFSHEIDYTKFSIVLKKNQIKDFADNLPNLYKQVKNGSKNEMINELKKVNNKYFISREKQIKSLIKYLKKL